MIAKYRVGPECDVIDADQRDTILEVLHDRLQAVPRMVGGQSGVGRGLDADHASLVRTGLDHLVRLQARAGPERTGAGVRDENRLLTELDGVERCLIA